MAIIEQTSFFIGILNDGQIEFRRTREFYDDSINPPELVAEKHHRQVLEPGQDVSSFPNRLRQICAIVWTPAVIEAYRTRRGNFRLPTQ